MVPEPEEAVDQNLKNYQQMFDENGKFKIGMFNQEMPDDFETYEETEANKKVEGEEEDDVVYDHVRKDQIKIHWIKINTWSNIVQLGLG